MTCNNCGDAMRWNTVPLCEKCADELYCYKGCGNKAPHRYARCKQCERKNKRKLKEIGKFLVDKGYLKEEPQ